MRGLFSISDAFYLGNDRVQTARSGRLWPYDLCNLQLAFGVCRTDDGLELSLFWRLPRIVPDYPRVGRHRLFNLTLIPGAACVKAQFDLTNRVGPAEGNTAEFVLGSAKRLVMPW